MKYFAYGSNMSQERMKKDRKVKFTRREHATLEGWELTFNKIDSQDPPKTSYANIIQAKKSIIVEGILYAIKYSDLKKLDKCEGYPKHYDRKNIKVQLDNDQKVKAVAYIAKHDKTKEGLKPSKKYLNYLLQGCDLLSEKYCKKLRNWETSE